MRSISRRIWWASGVEFEDMRQHDEIGAVRGEGQGRQVAEDIDRAAFAGFLAQRNAVGAQEVTLRHDSSCSALKPKTSVTAASRLAAVPRRGRSGPARSRANASRPGIDIRRPSLDSFGMFEIVLIPAFKDNYIWLLVRDGRAAVVDPGDAAPVRERLAAANLCLESILITHHHADHQGGVAELVRTLATAGVRTG